MRLLTSGQTTIADVTDGYSATLIPDSYTFKGNEESVDGTQTIAVSPSVICGTEVIPCEIDVRSIVAPSGITITSSNGYMLVTANNTVMAGDSFDVPIIMHDADGDHTFTRTFSYSIAFTGESAISVRIDSSAGNIFKNNTTSTILTCSVWRGSRDITSSVSAFTWIKKDKDGNVDQSWSRAMTGNSIVLTPADVDSKAVFECVVTL